VALKQAKPSNDGFGRRWLLVHGAVVMALTVFLLITEWLQPDAVADANIGGGGAFLGLLVIGLPWSVPAWFNFGWALRIFFAVFGAVANVGIHALILVWHRRRQRRAAAQT
jgi:hypothetical protein